MEECYMKISVVIAYHDEKQYIKDCLASLAEQTFQDFEVILVCDGCEAPEEGIPEKLNIVTVMQEEKGVAGARNAGIEKAQGEYVVFLDADDYLAEDTLEALAEKAEPETVVYISKTETWYSRKVYQDNGEKLDEQNVPMATKEKRPRLIRKIHMSISLQIPKNGKIYRRWDC